jgi:GTP pyrophosphokinase
VKAGFEKADDLFIAVGREEVNTRQLQVAIKAVVQPAAAEAAPEPEVGVLRQSKAAGAGSGILVVGVDRLMTVLARCCKPAPPDRIVGFVTRGKGVTIHRQSCTNVARLRSREPERLITADWGAPRDEVFPVDVVLEAIDRQGLLRDVSEVFSRERINVTAAKTQTRNHESRMAFTLEVKSLDALAHALDAVRDIPGVMSAGRRQVS